MRVANSFKKVLEMDKGSTSVIIMCTTLFVILASAFITDVSYAAIERLKLTDKAERIAKAGAEILLKDKQAAVVWMKKYATKEVGDLISLDIKISDNNRDISVYMKKPFSYLFLKHFGFENKQITANVSVRLSGVSSYKGVRPFAVQKQQIVYDKQYTLTNRPAGTDESIGIAALDFGYGNFKTSLLYGCSKTLDIGDGVYPLQGDFKKDLSDGLNYLISKCKHRPPCTFDNYSEDCTRIIIVPVVDRIGTADGEIMNILSFAAFFMESSKIENRQIFIRGRFIKHTVKSATSDHVEDYGLSGIKITRSYGG